MITPYSFMKQAKIIQDTYMGGSLQGQLYALEKLKSHIEFQIKDVQARIDETPTGKVLNNLTQSK